MAAILGVLAAILEPWRPSWPPFCDVIGSKPAPILLMSFSFAVHHLHYRKSCLSENMGFSQIWPTTWAFVNVLVPDVKTIHWV